MLREVLTILLLTLLFTITALASLGLRRGVRGGIGQMMYIVWLVVMLSALMPVRIGPPVLSLVVSERTAAEVQPPYRDIHPEILLITDATKELRAGDLPELRANLYEKDSPVVSEDGASVAFNLSGLMISGMHFLFFIWAAGMSYRMVRELLEYREIRRFLRENSDPCTNRRMLHLFERCCSHLGLRRSPALRRIREDCPMTPCVTGIFRPTVYLSAFCDDMDNKQLVYIFTHELCHVRRRDMLYKLLLITVLSVHWFNPIVKWVRSAVTEDCEMACDASVLRTAGAVNVQEYMEAILTVAERVRRERMLRRGRGEYVFHAAFYMAGDTSPSYLKRRYLHLKITREKKNARKLYTLCAGTLAAIVAGNIALSSFCSCVRAAELPDGVDDTAVISYDPLTIALHNYFGVSVDSVLTDAQYAQITAIDVYLADDGTDTACALFHINGSPAEYRMPAVLSAAVFESYIEQVGHLPQYGEVLKKFDAFYSRKDAGDPQLSAEGTEKMHETFPMTRDGIYYIFDPYATAREDDLLYDYCRQAGIVDAAQFTEADIRAAVGAIPALNDAVVRFYPTADDSTSVLFDDRGARTTEVPEEETEVSDIETEVPDNDTEA